MSKEKLYDITNKKGSRIILALDFSTNLSLIEEVRNYIVGVKIGLPLLLTNGIERIKTMINAYKDLYFIVDFKLSDVPFIIEYVIEKLYEIGFDGVIMHLFQGGVDDIVKKFYNKLLLIGVLMMSHKGSFLFKKEFEDILSYAEKLRIPGAVVGATRPTYIRRVKNRLKDIIIFSPGVGYQGSKYGSSLLHGADFEIIGRSITLSKTPRTIAREIVEKEREVLWKR